MEVACFVYFFPFFPFFAFFFLGIAIPPYLHQERGKRSGIFRAFSGALSRFFFDWSLNWFLFSHLLLPQHRMIQECI